MKLSFVLAPWSDIIKKDTVADRTTLPTDPNQEH